MVVKGKKVIAEGAQGRGFWKDGPVVCLNILGKEAKVQVPAGLGAHRSTHFGHSSCHCHYTRRALQGHGILLGFG